MTVCAQSIPEMYQNMNIYRAARLKAGIWSREAAEAKTNINWRTLERIETDKREPKPDEVLSMSHGYEQPELALTYCQSCPIGEHYMTPVEPKDLRASALGIASLLKALYKERDRLIEIAVDGIVSEAERPCMERIFSLLRELESEIKSLELWHMVEGLDFGQKEKPLCEAAR